MIPVDPISRTYPPGDLRVSDADRDAVLSELSEHFQAGRLTAAEFDDRAGRALAARTGKELAVLMSDLPSAASAASRRPGPAGSTGSSGLSGPAGPSARADATSGTGTGLRRMAGHSMTMAMAGIGVVIAVAAIAGDGHWQRHGGGSAPWGLILVAFIIYRCLARDSRRRPRSRRGE